MECRLKSISSIKEKIERKGWPMEIESVYKLTDFAGVRVICNYIDDVYTVERSLLRQDDIDRLYQESQGKRIQESASCSGSADFPHRQDIQHASGDTDKDHRHGYMGKS